MPATQLAPATRRLIPNPAGYPTYIVIAGIQATALVRMASVSITDVLNEQPNTAAMTVNLTPHAAPSPSFNPSAFDAGAFNVAPSTAVYPVIRRGQPIEVYSGGYSPEHLIFAGEIVSVRQVYDAQVPANVAYHLGCIDYTRALNRRKVTKSYRTESVTAIVLDLMASRLADGFTTQYVEQGLPSVAIDFTFEDMNRALTRLANRIGAYWYVDYTKALHFFVDEASDPPAPLEPYGEPFADLHFETDLSQVRTRVVVEGAGTNVATEIKTGETVIPVRDPVMFQAGGGLAIIGQQRITYGGVVTGGEGSLIGPGAQPGSAPIATPAVGTGIDIGTHGYAVTFQSAAGESLPSPIASVTLGLVNAPATAPTPNPPTAGNGPNPGSHVYGVSFLTATGETTSGPFSAPVTTTQAGGVPAPGATGGALRTIAGNLVAGRTYAYKTTITTAGGESLPGPAGVAITPTIPTPPPSAIPPVSGTYPQQATGGSLVPNMNYYYYASFIVGGTYETALSPAFHETTAAGSTALDFFWGFRLSPDARITGRKIYRSIGTANGSDVTPRLLATLNYNNTGTQIDAAYKDVTADGALGAIRANPTQPIGTPPGDQATVTFPSSADPRAVGRKIYRSDAGAPFRFLATINNNTATQYVDNIASVSSNADAPTTDTTGGALTCVVALTNIPIGPAGVTGRRLYRSPAGSTTLLVLATLNNNTDTTFTDTKTDSALGAGAPPSNTTINQRVALSSISTGGAGVTARKIYRTAANAAQLRYLATLGDNTTTTYSDAAADATLGANVPTTDTSGLQQPQGQVNAGATTIPVSSTAAFAAGGGFAVVGNGAQVIRYSGLTGTALTGVPASGPGALTSTVAYNSSITVAPALTGVPASGPGAISQRGLVDGEEIHLLVERNDVAAQTALAAIEGGDGVIEHYIQDRRLSHAGATATADAELQLFSAPEIRVSYTTRDARTRTGKTIAIDLPAPTNLAGAFLIQRVQFSRFDVPGVPPLRAVQASSTRFSFDDVLRRLEMEVSA